LTAKTTELLHTTVLTACLVLTVQSVLIKRLFIGLEKILRGVTSYQH